MIDYIDDEKLFSYTKNSEIDKTIPYLDTLIEETKKRKKGYFKEYNNNPTFFKKLKHKLMKEKDTELDYNKQYLHSKSFKKDGYIFRIKVVRTVDKDELDPKYIYIYSMQL